MTCWRPITQFEQGEQISPTVSPASDTSTPSQSTADSTASNAPSCTNHTNHSSPSADRVINAQPTAVLPPASTIHPVPQVVKPPAKTLTVHTLKNSSYKVPTTGDQHLALQLPDLCACQLQGNQLCHDQVNQAHQQGQRAHHSQQHLQDGLSPQSPRWRTPSSTPTTGQHLCIFKTFYHHLSTTSR